MKTCTIFDSDRFMIESHDNGAAYTIIRYLPYASVYIQHGDDGIRFREEFDSCINVCSPDADKTMQMINRLCAEYF